MSSLEEILKPIGRTNGRRTALEVFDALQDMILSGKLKPGAVVSQVALAKALDVSRTPVREAVRMLQEGGLLVGEPNYRSRVVGFDPEDINALYVKRIALEALGTAVTTINISNEKLDELRLVKNALESESAHESFSEWQTLHRRFHRLIAEGAGTVLANDLEQLELRSERYQSTYKGAHLPGWWQRGEAEHNELFLAIESRNAAQAGELAARHLARTALELLAALAPEYDTSRLRASMQFAIAGAKSLQEKRA